MKSVIFTFATHNHQPIGNFDHVIEEAYEKSYRPFFELAKRFPAVRFGTHFTGILIDWLEEHHPDHLAKVRAMVSQGQLEIISGGYYEPILSVIPPSDQQEQIARLSNKITEVFGTTARGMWLAERVWEQPMASVLHQAGIRYVLLDDTHFLHAGLREEDLTGYYITEDKGQTLAVFPISKALRYTMPFRSVDETIRVLHEAATERGDQIVTFADDGEKFGVWPQTFEHVYGNGTEEHPGWLEEFFRKLSENASWITMLPPGEALLQVAPRGRIYLPTASYSEMMQWSLPTADANQLYEDFLHQLDEDRSRWERYRSFVRGGYWRNFFAKYPEANHLHKHMMRTSERVQKLGNAGHDVAKTRTYLLRSQCNDPYWHGVFGGIYLSNLRHANYSALVEADRLLDTAENLTGVRMEQTDFDCDGADEVILESKIFSLFVKPALGGMIAEIDFKPRSFNATNIISRRPEAIHSKIAEAKLYGDSSGSTSIHEGVKTKEAGLEKHLVYDWYRHGCLIEHFLSPPSQHGEGLGGQALEDLRAMRFEELGDFVTSRFEWGWSDKERNLRMTRSGTVAGNPLSLTKDLSLTDSGKHVNVSYALTNESQANLRLRFATEWAFNLLAGSAPDRYYESDGKQLSEPALNSTGSTSGTNLRLMDQYLKLAIDLQPQGADEIVRFPIESISMSEGGFERIYQGSVVMPIWTLELAPGERRELTLRVAFEELP